jgi:glycosyltransferase involved in cell wall biosynthesis
MVGSLAARSKKHELFVDAVAAVAPGLDADFRIYGGAELPGDSYARSVRERILRRGLARRIAIRGFVADPARLMSEIDVLVHPADNESFGRVVVEAMAAGLPVVGVSGGGVGEIVVDGHTGLLVHPGDAAGLAAAITSLASDAALRASLGAAGRARAAEGYSLDRCAAGILSAYTDAMRRPLGWLGAPT